ncbi:YihY/virulence factor BrkB family protein [Pedobacter aquatilis]|uniref:YihY/virulence factor BrkB family protein n=1 Tax=Pedobacter aquatilis TaxID=351343 RepID=UPI00292D8F31|nr:YihY/virulence factor BrkB family protein [Pedobacter aquatilis]
MTRRNNISSLSDLLIHMQQIKMQLVENHLQLKEKLSRIWPVKETLPHLKTRSMDATLDPKLPHSSASTTSSAHKKITIKGLWHVLLDAFKGFGDHKVTKMSGSLAYYTVFSMGPLLIVVISLCGIFMKKEAAQGKVFDELKGFLGSETAMQLQDIIKHAGLGDKGTIAFIIGSVTLLLGATSVFGDIQDSINTIWGIKPKPKRGWLKLLQNRFLSFSVIISLGFLLLVSLSVTAVLDGFSNRLQARFADISVIIFYIFNTLLTLAVISTIFGVIFKVLPDAAIRWKDVIAGAMVTALLFMAGKFGISVYIAQSNVGGTYGAAGSLVVLLLWTYYSSIILYFGAEFTKAYAVAYGSEIRPNHYAVTIQEVEIEQGGKSVQAAQRESLASDSPKSPISTP